MSYSLHIMPAADADMEAAAVYIARDNLTAALRFYDAVNSTFLELSKHPTRWSIYGLKHPRLVDVRKRSIVGFKNYLVFYRIAGDVVEIIRVLHGARDIPSVLMEP